VPGTVSVLPVAGACALIVAGARRRVGVSRLLGTRPLVWVGDLSYSWYLWHWPVIVFAAALWPRVRGIGALAAALSLLPAWASFRFVENPIRSRQWSGRRLFALAFVCIVAPLVVAVV